MRTFVLGDIHGAFRALKQCMQRSSFDPGNDKLVFLGDVADGWSQVAESIEELLRIRDLIYVLGNHDIWLRDYLETGTFDDHWPSQGGLACVDSYRKFSHLKNAHLEFLRKARPYYLDQDNRLFIHAGFNPDKPVEHTDKPDFDYYWSRDVFRRSFMAPVMPELYKEIYIGHTPTRSFSDMPVRNNNVWLMDQGAGWNGYLSMMDIDNCEVFRSDRVTDLYPGEPGRMGLGK